MMYNDFPDKISILHPSRSRPIEALNTMVHWLQNIVYPQQWEYILSVDSNDPELKGYEALDLKGAQNMRMIVNDNQNIVQAANQAARLASGGIFILVSDDFLCFNGWNQVIREALKGKSGVLKTFDGIQRWIVTLPIMTRDYYEELGYFYHPSFAHMFCDTHMTQVADLKKKLIIRNDIVFKHNHYSIGGQPKDAVNIKADTTWAEGEKVFLQECKNKFGLPIKSVYDLSTEAKKAGHINWMKKKGVK